MSRFHKEQLLERVHDPEKIKFIDTLKDTELEALAGTYNTERSNLISHHPQSELMHAIRVIYSRQVTDWASEAADTMQKEITTFIESPTFVQYPDFLLDTDFIAAIKDEHMQNHARTITDLQGGSFFEGPGLEILGAKIVGDSEQKNVEVLTISNQIKPFPGNNGYMIFGRDHMNVPPKTTTGSLKKNPVGGFRGQGGEVYISMESPYPSRYGETQYTEVIIGHIGNDGIIMPVENV